MKIGYHVLRPAAGLILVMLAFQGKALAQGLDPGTLQQPPGQRNGHNGFLCELRRGQVGGLDPGSEEGDRESTAVPTPEYPT